MSFEEQFPSLTEKQLGKMTIAIAENCLDKAEVNKRLSWLRRAILKSSIDAEKPADYYVFLVIEEFEEFSGLKKELLGKLEEESFISKKKVKDALDRYAEIFDKTVGMTQLKKDLELE